ncbi:hypothetical protein RFM68_18185 [Mesorhizobium sp. MSK_1335]|uniref:DUF4412 domain-containing protein n=1 Tax=Mesorhizobium montanum TaxID=3072323 RepID=A0ABU4ZN22_9HYPH|nr:hypothetical protein [Mesorhizobium sp. MSK_1335]MDX8526432.1 hypothetical protein [Mesorhizobium sp. MSK_1335]
MRFLRYFLGMQLAVVAGASIVRAEEMPKPDPSCADVARIYDQFNRPMYYSITTYQLKDDGSLKLFQDLRVVNGHYYTRYSFSEKWLAHGLADFSSMSRMGPVFTSCKLMGKEDNLLHYSATWHEFPYAAAAELWVSEDSRRLSKMIRRYPDRLWQFPFATAVELYEYDDGSERVPDPSCADVNKAYDGENRPRQYSIAEYELKDDGSTTPHGELRIDDGEYYTKPRGSAGWVKGGPIIFRTVDGLGPRFISCKFVAEESSTSGKLLHYAAIWQKDGFGAASDIWLGQDGPRLIKLVRHFAENDRRPPYPVILEIYDYAPFPHGVDVTDKSATSVTEPY